MFKRTIEDFVCAYCKKQILGNGYTNHCPHCLYSKHVDIEPGDRLADCNGLMKPLSYFQKNGDFYIVHQCKECGLIKNNKKSAEDSTDTLLNLHP